MDKEHAFNSIGPSARALLFLKGYTDIPFAREMAELIKYPDKYNPDFSVRDVSFWGRILHFEKRYKSINKLLEELPVKNVLEIASGYSLRSFEITQRKEMHYIDTDLPDVIAAKKNIIESLELNKPGPDEKLKLLSLNALDKSEFNNVANCFPDGEIAIVNEGLLMYLDRSGKEKLCHIIRDILKKRGGYWITADIYVKKQFKKVDLKKADKWDAFFEQHNVKDNLFEDFKEAGNFFNGMGFVIDKEAHVKRSELSTLKYLIKSASIKQLYKFKRTPEFRSTWRLRITGS